MTGRGRGTGARLSALWCATILGASLACEQAYADPFEALRRDQPNAPLVYAQAGGTIGKAPWQPAPQSSGLSRFYGGAEYLLWTVKGAPLSVPIITTGPVATTAQGMLVHPDASILYGAPFGPGKGGNDTQEFPWFSGARLTLGYWLDDAHRFAIEGRGFALERKTAGYNARCDGTGRPVLNVPMYNTLPYSPGGFPGGGIAPQEDGLPACIPEDPIRVTNGLLRGGIEATNSLQFWGADVTGVMPIYRSGSWEVSALGGVRYLDLAEKFNLYFDVAGFSGMFVGQSGQTWDEFSTRNQFFGASLGLRGRHTNGPWSVELTSRVALGISHQTIDVSGGFTTLGFIGPGLTSSGREGIFAQPAIQGTRTADQFAFVPEAQLKVGYAITPWMRFTVGYEGLYYSNVVRPTDQINRNLPKGQTFQQGGTVASTTSPTGLFNRTDFWAHGLSIGLAAALDGPELYSRSEIITPPPAVNWAGPYVGGHLGGNFDHYNGKLSGGPVPGQTNQANTPDVVGFGTGHEGAFVGGGQIGYNQQSGSWVFGVEADVSFSNAKPGVNGPGSNVFATTTSFEFRNEWQGSLRGRAGFAFDRWLAYGTGGVAWNSVNVSGTYGPGVFVGDGTPAARRTTPAASASEASTLFGGTAGVGVEYALTNNVSLAGEYRYTAFAGKSFTLGSIPFPFGQASQVSASLDKSKSEITARLNYRFQ